MMKVTQVFSVRLAILTLAMPIFLLFGLVALVDGLAQRELLCLSLCEEGGTTLGCPDLGDLSPLPFSLRPTFVILPFATLFSLTVAVMASTFK